MTLHLESPTDTFNPWKGEPIDGIRYPLSIESKWTFTQLAAINLYKVQSADPIPTGKRIISTSIQRVDNIVKYVNITEDIPLEEFQNSKIQDVNTKVSEVLASGFTVPESASTVMAGQVLQTRNLEDRTNWLVSQASYSAAVGQGYGAVEGAKFRTESNDTFTVSYLEGLTVLLAMASWGAAAMDNSWALKDAINTAEDKAALDAIDIESGWPT